VARVARERCALDAILWVPAARPPHKPHKRLASEADRVAMLELALAGDESAWISTLEYERSGPSYTFDTLRELPARAGLRPDCQLFLLLGWDNLRGLERWHRAADVLALAQPVVVWREGGDETVLAHLRATLPPQAFARLESGLVRVSPSPESSTDVRARLERGEWPVAAVPAAVLEYIRSQRVYGGGDE
jgi:nicotinate-nucleotide adenylyltransferase